MVDGYITFQRNTPWVFYLTQINTNYNKNLQVYKIGQWDKSDHREWNPLLQLRPTPWTIHLLGVTAQTCYTPSIADTLHKRIACGGPEETHNFTSCSSFFLPAQTCHKTLWAFLYSIDVFFLFLLFELRNFASVKTDPLWTYYAVVLLRHPAGNKFK